MSDENVIQPADATISEPDTQPVVETETLPNPTPPATQADPSLPASPNSSVPTDLPGVQPVAPQVETPVPVAPISPQSIVVPTQSSTTPTPAPPTIPTQVSSPSEPQVQSKFPSWNWREMLIRARESVQLRKKAKLEKIMKLAQAKKFITNDQVQLLLRVSDSTARDYLNQLIRAGRLRAVGSGHSKKFEAIS